VTRLLAAAVVVLVLAGLAAVALASGRPGRSAAQQREREVVSLSDVAEPRAARAPQERISAADMAAAERATRRHGGASTTDGVAEGAPSDREVRRMLRELKHGGELPADPIRPGSGDLIWPINGQFTSPFGMRWGRLHAGIDLAAPTGKPIRAAASGRVTLMAPTGGYGLYTCIRHSASISTCYAHQSRFGTAVGRAVRKGEVIGYVGNTGHSFGAHLHFEVRIDGRPVDPTDYL
jgi:murein DD-endopeptidase MepM/ murein hydrolase activator NlpD